MSYLKNIAKSLGGKATPQSQPLPGTQQVPNSAGGYGWAVTDWVRLDRFLVLGSEGGSYYASERKLSAENAGAVIACIKADGLRVVARIVEVSEAGRAPKNDPAILALALAFTHGDPATRRAAGDALPRVCRIGTHLFHFAQYIDSMRGWGRGLRRAVSGWYTADTAASIAYQAAKYQSRDGWSHRDLLRLAHPVAPTEDHNLVFNWIVDGWPGVGAEPHPVQAAQILWAMERAKVADKAEVLRLISDYRLPREMLPTVWLTDPDVWAALLPQMGLTALLRNLGTLSKIGLLGDGNPATVDGVVQQISSNEALRKARIHPIAVLTALITYGSGRGVRGAGSWMPVGRVIDALDSAFYKAFANVEPAGKRMLLALDVSGSMSTGMIGGVRGLTPRIASAAMALVTASTEQDYTIIGFSHELVPLPVSPRQRLDDVVKLTAAVPMGATDCAQPMLWALENRVEVDTFVVYTDSETWFGAVHPSHALRTYRESTGIPARLIVVGMLANQYTIADPLDAGMLDVVGFDTATPQIIADFARA